MLLLFAKQQSPLSVPNWTPFTSEPLCKTNLYQYLTLESFTDLLFLLFNPLVTSDSFVTLWATAAHEAPLSMGFSRQEYWSGLPCPSPGDLPDPGIEPASPALAGGFFTTSTTWEAHASTYSQEKWNESRSLQRELCMNSHSSATNSSQNIEIIQTPISLWMDEQKAAYPHSGILFNHMKN